MSSALPTRPVDEAEFLALVGGLRPELHRYCARLTGSIIDGEDVVQDSLTKAFLALDTLDDASSLKGWLFRIAHNQALDFIRRRATRATEPIEAADAAPDPNTPDPLETLMHQEALGTAVSRFVELPTPQRSAVILKDVLGHTLEDIADLLSLSVDSVKAHLARGRARLKQINAASRPAAPARVASAAVARYVGLFNRRDWDGLRSLLAEDVRLKQSTYPLRVGAADVGNFFSIYSKMDAVELAPAWLEGREVIAVFEQGAGTAPSYFMWLEWRDGRITYIRDYRYLRYVVEGAELIVGSRDGDAVR